MLQAALAGIRDRGAKAVAVEVSSHGLSQHRVDAMRFDVAAFTNLSRDHLDHHRTMEEYYRAKALLFDADRSDVAVVDTDDRWGRRLAGRARGPSGRARAAAPTPARSSSRSARPRSAGGGAGSSLPLQGAFNVDNALVAAGVALSLGIDEERDRRGARPCRSGAGPYGARPRRCPFRGDRRLRAHPGRARDGPRSGQDTGRPRTGDLRVRLRRRPRPGQASGDGCRRVTWRGHSDGDLGQPALGGSAIDRRRGGGGHGRRGGARSSRSTVPTAIRAAVGGRATGDVVLARRERARDHPDHRWRGPALRRSGGGETGAPTNGSTGRVDDLSDDRRGRRPVGGGPLDARAHPVAGEERHRPAHPRRRAPRAHREGRYADDGRDRHRDRGDRRLLRRAHGAGGDLLAVGGPHPPRGRRAPA